MTKSNAEEFILLLFDGQKGFTRLGAAGKGQTKLYPLFNVCKSILDREREGKKAESLKPGSKEELLQRKPKNKTNGMLYL